MQNILHNVFVSYAVTELDRLNVNLKRTWERDEIVALFFFNFFLNFRLVAY